MPLIRTALRPRGVVFADLFFVLAVLAFLFAAALAMAQDIPTDPVGAAKAVGGIADTWREAGPYGTAAIFLCSSIGLWWFARKDRAAYDAKVEALQTQVVKILQDFLGQHKG